MSSYLDYLKSIQSDTSRKRLRGYLDHNFREHLVGASDILEIGPGLGDFLQFAGDCGVKNIDVMDRDPSILDHLKSSIPIRNAWLASMEDLGTLVESLPKYDIIFMLQIVEHVKKDSLVEMLRLLYSRLNPGGKIIVTVPNGGNPLSIVERYSDITHENLFSENSFRQLVSMCSLENVEVSLSGYKIPPTDFVNVIRIIVQKTLHLFLKGLLVANGGVFFNIMEPNITLVVKRSC